MSKSLEYIKIKLGRAYSFFANLGNMLYNLFKGKEVSNAASPPAPTESSSDTSQHSIPNTDPASANSISDSQVKDPHLYDKEKDGELSEIDLSQVDFSDNSEDTNNSETVNSSNDIKWFGMSSVDQMVDSKKEQPQNGMKR